jgi:hypothetical protein
MKMMMILRFILNLKNLEIAQKQHTEINTMITHSMLPGAVVLMVVIFKVLIMNGVKSIRNGVILGKLNH